MAAVELGLDVGRHLDAVDDEVGDQSVDLGVLHDHADQAGAAQVALAELRAGQVLRRRTLSMPRTLGLATDSAR